MIHNEQRRKKKVRFMCQIEEKSRDPQKASVFHYLFWRQYEEGRVIKAADLICIFMSVRGRLPPSRTSRNMGQLLQIWRSAGGTFMAIRGHLWSAESIFMAVRGHLWSAESTFMAVRGHLRSDLDVSRRHHHGRQGSSEVRFAGQEISPS